MNCQKAEQVIPLFVETDLAAAEMQQVHQHLETCPACCESAAEFETSQSLLRAATVPAFDETMLAEMRSAVLQQVAPAATQPMLGAWWQPIWSWKFAIAVAVILLVVGVAIRQRGAKLVENQVAREANNLNSASATGREKLEIKPPAITQRLPPRTGRKPKAQGEVSVRERDPGNGATRHPSPVRATDVDTQIAALAPSGAENDGATFPRVDTLGFTLPPAPQAETAKPTNEKSTPEPEMLRMEFQTADPNIRIIWLTPKEPARTSPAADTK